MRLILHIAACGAIALTFAVPALSLTCGLILWTLVTLVVAIRQALDYCSTPARDPVLRADVAPRGSSADGRSSDDRTTVAVLTNVRSSAG